MRIKDISVENYRNLNSATITFDESCNFIVGENNLGKSNILNLLNIIFTRRGFVYDDFNDANLPITVNIRIKLTNDEIGHFEDLFDIDDYTYINIICKQVSPDDNMEFYHLAYIIHSGFISGYQNRYGDNLKPPTNVYHRMTA